MRLMADGIQPVDKYVLYRDNPHLWVEEMEQYNLTDEEKDLVREHIGESFGVSDSQEEIMLLSMDERIANFTIPEADNLRKAVAKIDVKVLAEVKELFFSKGKQNTSKNLLQYIWDTQIMPQAGYGFSALHSAGYSLIALQNMNLAHKYPAVYWSTACLTVNSGADETSDANKASNYGKVAASIGNMQERGVKIALPDINTADFGFKPNAEENTIVFGLRGIHGIGSDIVHSIISNRPYTSFEDFLKRMYEPRLVQNNHVLQLIKAGSFDSFGDRTTIMQQYVAYNNEPRNNLTLASFNTLIQLGLVPEKFDLHVRYFNYRRHIFQKPVGRSDERKTKNRIFSLDTVSTEFLFEHFTEDCIVDYDEVTGNPMVGEWLFDREYERKMAPIREWLAKESTLEQVNKVEFMDHLNNATSGNISRDEMDSLSYYYSGHELDHLNKDRYGVRNFSEQPLEPVPTREYEYRGQTRYEYEVYRIAGTVLDKDKNRHTVTILTTDGVVVVKLWRNVYSSYDRQISEVNPDGTKTVLERSWFTRGNLIMFTGYRRGNQFIPRTFRSAVYQDPVILINSIDDEGDINISTERVSY